MSTRKGYSRERAKALWKLVDDAVTSFRIAVLRGELYAISSNEQEEIVCKRFCALPDMVVKEYCRKMRAGNSKK